MRKRPKDVWLIVVTFATTLVFFSCGLRNATAQLSADHFKTIPSDQTQYGYDVSYLGRVAENGKIELNANNGFFTNGVFRAEEKQLANEVEKQLISAQFRYLSCPTRRNDGTARWHVWLPEVGNVKATVYFKLPDTDAGSRWQFKMADQKMEVQTTAAKTFADQPWELEFDIKRAGKHTLQLSRVSDKPTPKTEIHRIELSGSAVEKASVLRARWRPAAIHTQYSSSKCTSTNMWVFESQSVTLLSSYSPMTTRFGYFGASFNSDGNAAGGVNFSMWAARGKAKEAPPLESMPHLLATGNPKADFGGFGHEGSGVKIRNWQPFAHQPKSVIQALRVESQDGWDTFSGYLFDERTNRWTLYAIGRKPTKKTNPRLRSASFCEIPGPPARQRSGDQMRIMRRRGWFLGSDKQWHVVDQQKTSSSRKSSLHRNKFIAAKDGWLMMGTGGMEMLSGPKQVKLDHVPSELPKYLQPENVKQLFERPVEFGASKASEVRDVKATIEYELEKAGSNAKAILHYGTVDCLTFVDREIHGTEKKGVSQAMLAKNRTWQLATEPITVRDGNNRFGLTELKPNTTYFYRLMVFNDEGKGWDFVTGTFSTK